MTLRHIEIPWKEIDDLIWIKLKAAGFDRDREVVTWTKFENDRMTLVYEQEVDAKLTTEAKMHQAIIQRPSYLGRYPG